MIPLVNHDVQREIFMSGLGQKTIALVVSGPLRLMVLIGFVLTLGACQLTGFGGAQTASVQPIVDQDTLPAKPRTQTQTQAQTQARPPIQRQGTYRVKPGDSLHIFVFDNPDMAQTVIVSPDGRINFPLVGNIRAEGKTLPAIDSILTARLRENILQPEVTVSLAQVALRRLYVTGEVIAPGVFETAEPISVVQAISMAGGFTVYANRTQIIVYNPARTKGARRFFNYNAFLVNPAAYDFVLRPGDTVIVQ